jgi:type III pantothenate kinase
MILVLDKGNTRSKAAVYQQDSILELVAFGPADEAEKLLELVSRHAVTAVIVSNVGGSLAGVPAGIKQYYVDRQWEFPFTNLYKTPETLGIDRMILASGAVLAFPGINRLVIDAGTCITYDFVDAKDCYYGGAISPGLVMRYRAMHEQTAKLPLLALPEDVKIIGGSTEESMHSGVVNGVVAEIDYFVNKYKENRENFIIILTGGDSEFLAKKLKNTIFAHPNFLLDSLNRTFQYQSSND